MNKKITRIVLTGGPAAGKTTLISRILKEFTQEKGWKVVIIPETATELISGFGIGPFPGCMSMLEFQYFVIEDQLHKERLALKAAETVPEEKVLVIYDRAIFDDKAYISDEEFREVLAHFGKTEEELLAGYDAVLHLVSCAKGAEFAYDYGNAARYETVEQAAALDDRIIAAWTGHPHLRIIDNTTAFEEKLERLLHEILSFLGEPTPLEVERAFLIEYPDVKWLESLEDCRRVEITQTYLLSNPGEEVRVRQQGADGNYSYYETVKKPIDGMTRAEVERHLTQKEYLKRLQDADPAKRTIRKTRYRLMYEGQNFEIDLFPFWQDRALCEIELADEHAPVVLPPQLRLIREVTDDPAYSNAALAQI